LSQKTITEAGIKFVLPIANNDEIVPKRSDPVFYNKTSTLNRDLTLLVLHASKELGISKIESVSESFSGTGIRALRFALQGPDIKKLFINDISLNAIELTKENFNIYSIDKEIHYYNTDGKLFYLQMRDEENFLDYIDLDPYGTPQPFIRSALLTLENSGIMGVTATDMPVITGIYPDKAYRLYNVPNFKLRNRSYCHELGLRMFIAYLQREGLFYKMPLVPLLSFYSDHYVRVFMHYDKKFSMEKIMHSHGYVLDCRKCFKRTVFNWKESFKLAPICPACGRAETLTGPLYLGQLHNESLINHLVLNLNDYIKKQIVDRRKKIEKLIPLFQQDLIVNKPWFYSVGAIGKILNISMPSPQKIVSLLREQNYSASLTHFNNQSLRTDYALEIDELNILRKK